MCWRLWRAAGTFTTTRRCWGVFVILAPDTKLHTYTYLLTSRQNGSSVLNSTHVNLSPLTRPPFSCHPGRFTSPNSVPSLQELLQKISLCLTGFVRTQRTPLDPPLVYTSWPVKITYEMDNICRYFVVVVHMTEPPHRRPLHYMNFWK